MRVLGLLFLVVILTMHYYSDTLEPSSRYDALERLILQDCFALLVFVDATLLMTGAVVLWIPARALTALTRSLRR